MLLKLLTHPKIPLLLKLYTAVMLVTSGVTTRYLLAHVSPIT